MRTAQERIAAMHGRADALRRARRRRSLARLGAADGALFAGLCALIFGTGRGHGGVSAGAYTGAVMLFENAGGYVLVALAAFAVGVGVTVALLRHGKKDAAEEGEDPDAETNERGSSL